MNPIVWVLIALFAVTLAAWLLLSRRRSPSSTQSLTEMGTFVAGLLGSKASDAFLIVTLANTGQFIQMTPTHNGVLVKFPLAVPKHKTLGPVLRSIADDMALSLVDNSQDQMPALNLEVEGDAYAVAEVCRTLFARLFDAPADSQVAYECNGFHPGA
jgi:hypothetical protein